MKWVTIGLSILVLLVLAVVIAQTIINNKVDTLLRNKLEEQLGPDYDIAIASCHFSIIQNKLTVKDLEFTKQHSNTHQWIIRAQHIKLKGFRPFAFLFGKGFGLDELILDRPEIHVTSIEKRDSTASKNKKKSSKTNDLKIHIGAIKCINGTFIYNPDGPEMLNSNFNLSLHEIDFTGRFKSVDQLWKKANINLTSCVYQFPDSTYILTVDSIELPYAAQEIEIKDVRFKSNRSKTAFPEYFGWRKSRFDVTIPKLQITRPANFTDSLFILPRIEIDSMRFEIHKDTRYPWPERVTALPQKGLSKMKIKFKIDSINFYNSAFTFISVFEDDEPSKLHFSEISGSLSGLQNVDTTTEAFTFEAHSTFMHHTSLGMKTTYAYGKDAPFVLTAEMGSTKLGFMSDFLQSAAGIRITDGNAEKLMLSMSGNKYGEYGHVDFYYTNLKLEAVNKETGDEKWLLNLAIDLARGVFFWKKNPENKNFRRGKFRLERTVYKGFPSQWVEGLTAGIIESISKIDPEKVQAKE